MVELLITSDIAKYCEFKLLRYITGVVLWWEDGGTVDNLRHC